MPITFIRTTPFPNCRYCQKPMGYYVPGLPDEKHSHPECQGKADADAIMEKRRVAQQETPTHE